MAGCFFSVVGSTGFWLSFVISETIALLSNARMEDLLMVKKAVHEVTAYAKLIKDRVIGSWEIHLPSRLSLLKSL